MNYAETNDSIDEQIYCERRTSNKSLPRIIGKVGHPIKTAVVDTNEDYQTSPSVEEQLIRPPTTPPYQRLTRALKSDARCGHEVTIGRRIGLYRFCGDIGRGNFSKVKLAVHQLTRDKVAIKVVDRSCLDSKASQMLSSEIGTLECVYHPNILRLFEVVETMGRVYLITEWVRGGELYNHITQHGPIPELRAALLFKQLLNAVKHMHSLGFVHRDIKAENVLLLSDDCLKLADFGFSTQLINGAEQKLNTFCGSPPYAAPELFSDDHYIGAPVDVWALGILLYFMVVGNMPFRAPTIPGLKAAILKGDYILPGQLSLPCVRLIQRILVHVPHRRPNLDEVLSSQFLLYPQLSERLMQREISMLLKSSHSVGIWMRTKSQRLRKAQTMKERYIEVANKQTVTLNTRKYEDIYGPKFLFPIDINCNASEDPIKPSSKICSPKRASIFYGTLRRKISPLDIEKKKQSTNQPTSLWNIEVPLDCSVFKNYDLDIGKYVMLPSLTEDLDQLAPIEMEARQILLTLGITSEMLFDAMKNGPRSDIIGVYRIVVNRLQKQSWMAQRNVELALQKIPKSNKKTRMSCCIL